MSGRIVVGTSSWADPGFVARWYPRGLPARERLAWYAQRFEAVELNASFYAIPGAAQAGRWAALTPSGFRFDVKLHRVLSRHAAGPESLPADLRPLASVSDRGRVHLTPRLEAELVARTLAELAPLIDAGKLSCFLLQLSPAFGPREHELCELDPLVAALAPHRVAVELRHRGWVREERVEATLDWYERHGVVWVAVDAPVGEHPTMMPALDAVTEPGLAYLRAHGRNAHGFVHGRSVAERFGWVYSEAELQEIAGRARAAAEEAGAVHVMFNNNRDDDAPVAARRLRELLGEDPGPPAIAEPMPGAGDQLRLV